MKIWKKVASVNPELIDKRENLSVDSGLFFGDKTRNFLKLCYKS